MDWFQPHLNFPAKKNMSIFHWNWRFSLSILAKKGVLHVWNCQKSIILDLSYLETCHLQKIGGNLKSGWNHKKIFEFWKKFTSLCSRKFQNVKLRLEFVENLIILPPLRSTWNQILANSYSPKMSFWAILEVLNFAFSKFEQLQSPAFTKNSKFRVSVIAKNDIFGLFEFAKFWFHVKSEWR